MRVCVYSIWKRVGSWRFEARSILTILFSYRTRRHSYVPSSIFLLLASIFPLPSSSQEKVRIEIINANTLAGSAGVKKLLGNVILRQDNATMTCDSAYLYDGDSRFEGYSNVFINQGDSMTLAGDKVIYDGSSKQAQVTGKTVKLKQGNMALTTDRIDYNMRTKEANYTTGAKMLSAENSLTSRFGTYYSNTKEMLFKKNVVLSNPDYIMRTEEMRYNTQTEISYFTGPTRIVTTSGDTVFCRKGWYDTRKDLSNFSSGAYISSGSQRMDADSMIYDRKLGWGRAYQHILFTDTAEHIELNGHRGQYWQKTRTAVMTDSALAIQISDGDSIFIHADTLYYADDSTKANGKLMLAYRGARVYKSDLQAKADSLAYSWADSTIKLYNDPVLWHKENQLTADTIFIYRSGKGIDSLQLRTHSFVCSQEKGPHFNQIKGENISGLFDSSDLRKVVVTGGGESIYYIKEDSLHYTGINHINCDHMAISLAGKEVKGIRFYMDNKGELLPVNSIPPAQNRLKGYTWRDALRPKDREGVW